MKLCFASYLYNDKLLFGGYPNEEWFRRLFIEERVLLFVNLTEHSEMQSKQLCPYFTNMIPSSQYIHYPISDNNIPHHIESFQQLLYRVLHVIRTSRKEEKVYIHCKGGHGRSGMVAACLVSYLMNIIPEYAISLTTKAHQCRENLKPKYKTMKCPQIFIQRKFVIDFCRPIIISDYFFTVSSNLISFLEKSCAKPLLICHYHKKDDDISLQSVLLYIREYIISHLLVR